MSILKDLNTRLMLTAMLIFTPGVLYANEMDLIPAGSTAGPFKRTVDHGKRGSYFYLQWAERF